MAHSKLLETVTTGGGDPQSAQLATISQALGIDTGGSLASIAYFVARATRQGEIGQADLNADQNGFIANVFLPVAGMLALKTSTTPGADGLRDWQFQNTEEQRVVTITGAPDEHSIELIWNRNESSTLPTVEIDSQQRVNRITIPHLDYDSKSEGRPFNEAWRHHILQTLMGTFLYPHRSNNLRTQVAEPVEQASVIQEGATAAGAGVISLGLPKFLAVMPPNTGARQVITDLTYFAATEPASRYAGQNLHIVLTRRNDNLNEIAERVRSHPRRDQVAVFTGHNVQSLGLGGVLERVEGLDSDESGGQTGKSAILLMNTTAFRQALRSELAGLTGDDFDLFDLAQRTLEDQPYTPLTIDAHITQVARQEGIELTTDEVRLFENLSNRLRSISFYDADHIGAPMLYPFLTALSRGDRTVSIGTSNIPVHHQRNIFADVYDNMLYMGFTDSPTQFFGLTAQRMLTGDPIVHQLALGVQEGLYPRLRRAYVLTEDELLPDSVREDVRLYVSGHGGTMSLNRDNPQVYHHVFTRIAPLILQHERGIINCSSRDEAIAVSGYLNEMFDRLTIEESAPQRRFGFDIDGRTQQEQAESESSRLSFKAGAINFLVRVERDDGIPLRECTCLIDLTRNFSTRRFEQRFSHMLAPEKGKYGVDVLFLSDKDEARFAQSLDLFIAIKNGYFRPEGVNFNDPAPVTGFPSLPDEFERLFTEDGMYAHHVLQMEAAMTASQKEFWTSRVESRTQKDIQEATALIQRLQKSPYSSKQLILSRPEAQRLSGILHNRGELVYRGLHADARKFIDENGILRHVREEILEEGRPLVVAICDDRWGGSRKDVGTTSPTKHPRFVPYASDQRFIAECITEYVSRFNELPVERSILGHKLRMALNAGDDFLAMLPGEVVHRIQDEGITSRAAMFQEHMETVAAKVKRNEAQIRDGNISERLRQDLIEIRVHSGSVDTVTGFYPGWDSNDFERIMKAVTVEKDVQQTVSGIMNGVSSEAVRTARLLDDFVRRYHCLPVTIGANAAPGLWSRVSDIGSATLLPLLRNRDAKVLMESLYAQAEKGLSKGEDLVRSRELHSVVEDLIRVAAEAVPIPQTTAWGEFIARDAKFQTDVMEILTEYDMFQEAPLSTLANSVRIAWEVHLDEQRPGDSASVAGG